MAMSTRGIARHFLGRTGALSLRQVVGGGVSLRNRLENAARQNISFAVSECVYGWTAAYEQTWSHVRVRIQLNPDAGVTTLANLQTTWATTIAQRWSNRWAIGRPGEAQCPLTFEVQFGAANPHHAVRVRTGPARSNMTLWDDADTGDVAAHEFGHMLGNPDEYTDTSCPVRNPVNSGTVMDNNSNTVPQRLVTRFATEVGSNIVAITGTGL